jgi:hypothetical protein
MFVVSALALILSAEALTTNIISTNEDNECPYSDKKPLPEGEVCLLRVICRFSNSFHFLTSQIQLAQ